MKSFLKRKNFFVVWVFLAVLSTSAKVANCETYGEGTGENTVPVACIAEGDRTIEAASNWEARVTLDGSCSSDADSTAGTNDDINDFAWYEVVDICDANRDIFLGSGEIIEYNLPLGAHVIVLDVRDVRGASDSNEAVFTVEYMLPLMTEPSEVKEPDAAVIAYSGDSNNMEEEAAGILAGGQGASAGSGKIIGWGYQVAGVDLSNGFVAVAAGHGHSLGVKQDGSIVAWGENASSQCNVPSPNAGFAAVAGGGYHSLGLKQDGSIVAWGDNDYGQCNVPLPNSGFVAVAAGNWHSLGLKQDGSIVAWGDNDYGQCNVPLPNSGFVAVAAGFGHSLGVKQDGSIVAWGWNASSQCNVPSPNTGFVAVAAGYYHSLAIKQDGSIVAWGFNGDGQCNVPSPNTGFVAVSAGGRHSLGLKQDGSIVAWGSNSNGQCNVPSPNTGFVAVSAGGRHSLGLKQDGSIVAWGWNGVSQCNVPLPNTDFTAVAGGVLHSLGLKQDGSIVAWGYNNYGQCNIPLPNTGFAAVEACYWHSLGLKQDGSTVAWGWNNYGQCNVPSPNTGFVAVAAGYYHSLAIKQDGSIVAWGLNNFGQCNVPSPNTGFVAVAAGYYHSLAIKQDGSIVAWGWNNYGQCNVPSPNTGFVAVAAGYYHSLALKQNGSIVAWGSNSNGQCNVPSPNTGFVTVAAGELHNLGLKEDGSIVAWGWNGVSQCNVPLPNTGFTDISTGVVHNLAILNDNKKPDACIYGGDRTLECEATVTLDGSCSSDADSTPGTNDDINDFDWYDVIDPCDPNSDIFLGSGQIIDCNLPLGEHDIILEVTDKAGAFDTNEVTITVEDRTPPVLTCPDDIAVSGGFGGAEVTYDPTATDECDANPAVTTDIASGSFFETGVTTVTATATDSSGNSSMCTFDVIVSCFGINEVKLKTEAGKKGDDIKIKGTFNPGVPIDLMIDDVIYTIDDQGHVLEFFIPAGSFELEGKGDKDKYKFHSPKGSVPEIETKFDFDKCKFEFKAKKVGGIDEITRTSLKIILQAGANIAQEIVELEVKGKKGEHLEYKRKPKFECCPKCKGIALLEVTSTDPFTGDEYVLLFEPEPGKEKLKANTVVDDGVNGPVKIHTSCSKPIDVDDEFGPYTITGLIKIFDD